MKKGAYQRKIIHTNLKKNKKKSETNKKKKGGNLYVVK